MLIFSHISKIYGVFFSLAKIFVNKKQILGKFPINLRSGEFWGIFANFLGIFGKNFLVTLLAEGVDYPEVLTQMLQDNFMNKV